MLSTDRAAHWQDIVDRVNSSPYYQLLGLRVEEIGEGRSRLRLSVGERFHQLQGAVHGGVAAAVADSCIGIAVLSLSEPGQRGVTVEMKINYLGPLYRGEVIGEGRVIHRGRTLLVGEGELRDQDGRLVAKATATYMLLSPANGAS
ncbi:MAG: PaaI family thioesterase [Chloroflexota bacterium]